jgi:lipoate-protein ligase A
VTGWLKNLKLPMLCINLQSTDPCFNLTLEELLLRREKEEYLILYVNSPSVIIGKHQVAHRETDTEFVTVNSIPVVRRISGGGTVYHDQGNLNFTFILQSKTGSQVDFRKYTKPVIDFLATIGIDAKFEGKNDLKISGLKISGNAEHIYRERVLHHGTILFDTDIEMLNKTIRKDTSCYSSRGVASNPSPVMNLKQILPGINNMNDFRQEMYGYFINRPGNDDLLLNNREIEEAGNIADSKFRTWEWNYAYGPDYHFHNSFIFNNEKHSLSIFVKDGIIKECKIEGSGEMKNIGEKLIGCRHMPENLEDFFNRNKLNISRSDIYRFF